MKEKDGGQKTEKERKGKNVMKVNLMMVLDMLDLIVVWPVLLYRWCKFGYPYRKIYLGEGEYAIVDPLIYYRLKNLNWYLNGNGKEFYAFRNIKTGPGKTKRCSMHREIMGFPEGLIVDHHNNNPLDNRIANLRKATQSQNMQNRVKKKNTSSRFIGVCFDKKAGKWRARINVNGKDKSLGYFDNEEEAAGAYDAAAKILRGQFAKLNFPESADSG